MKLVDLLLGNDVDLKNIKIDQRHQKLQNPVLKNFADNELYPWPYLVMESDSFMDAVINSDETDVAFLKYLEKKGLEPNQTQLELIGKIAEKYGTRTTLFEFNENNKLTIHYPYAAEVRDYMESKLNDRK